MARVKYKTIPQGYRVIQLPDGEVALQRKSRRRRRYKMSKEQRQKIRAAAKRFKLPVLTMAAQLPWAIPALQTVINRGDQLLRGDQQAVRDLFYHTVTPFTGIYFENSGNIRFDPKQLLRGLGPNLAVYAINRMGLFRSLNRKLARSKIPIRLS